MPTGRARAIRQAKRRARRLISAANELLTLAREIELEFNFEQSVDMLESRETSESPFEDSPLWGELARQKYQDRRRRTLIFETDELFGEPAWDILLDLFIAAKERKLVSVTAACIAADVPTTTALRWLTILEKHQLIIREDDKLDGRRSFVRLTTKGYKAMVDYFKTSSRPIVELEWEKPREAKEASSSTAS